MSCPTVIELNGKKYQEVVSAPGRRAVVVVDRGWIFAGDVTEKDGRIKLDRAVHVLSWQTGGFAGLVDDPKAAKANIKPMTTQVDIPADSEIARCPVGDNWGL